MRLFEGAYRYVGNILYRLYPLHFLMPDKMFLQCDWRKRKGYELDFSNLQTLNEKLQWIKVYDRNPLYSTLVDKYMVKDWFKLHYDEKFIIPTIATYNSPDEIDLSKLPEKFILKCNHDSGNYLICTDKDEFDMNKAKSIFTKALSTNWYMVAREWPYKGIKKRLIICEPLLQLKGGGIPNDYKLHYINGELQFVYVSFDRQGVNDRCTFDKDWNRLPFLWIPERTYREGMNTADVPRPKSFDLMKKYGSEIAKMFRYVRVDFYDVDGQLYFGEITLFHGSGYDEFFPKEYDYHYGKMLKL